MSLYTPELAESICAQLATGKSAKRIAEEMGFSRSCITNWGNEHPEFAERSKRAREAGCHALADECLDIADDGRNDWMEQHQLGDDENDKPSGYKLNGEHVQRSRLRIDTRLRLLGKWLPQVYGDKVTQEISGINGAAIELISRRIIDPNPPS